MQAVILAGGKGERLQPLTYNIPKPMVEAAGRPFLEHLVLNLKKNGIRKFLFLTGYLGHIINDYFGDGSRWGVTIDYSFEEEPLGTGGALRLARDKLDEHFFLLFGDSYLPIDYRDMLSEYHRRPQRKAILAVYDNTDDTNVPFNIILGRDLKEVAVYNKAQDNPVPFNYCDAGVLIVNREVVDMIRGDDPVSFEEVIYPRLVRDGQLGSYISDCRFYDIGTIERLGKFEKYILRKNDYHKNPL